MKCILRLVGLLSLLCQTCLAVSINTDDEASIKSAASSVAAGLMSYYTGNRPGDVPGNLPDPYFWWEAGAMFGTMIDYWHLTKDETYTDIISQAMIHQAGDDKDYMPTNQTRAEGNDDQGFWAMSAMSAAENRFPDPPPDQPQWLALAQAVFNQYAMRWDAATCNGGLRWQIFTFNNGFNYKNSISNGCFFNLAARLARFTGNATYADWATRVFAWEQGVGLITPDFRVFDGAGVDNGANCTQPDTIQWSYNAGIYMHGAAVMYNITSGAAQATWKANLDGIWNETRATFFNGTILQEQACETVNLCDIDQQSFKGYLARWMAATTQVAPYTFDTMLPLLKSSASAAAAACSGSPATGYNGDPGTACGLKWTIGGFDGLVGVGQQMNALSAIQYTLVKRPVSPASPGGGASGGGGSGGSSTGGGSVAGGAATGDDDASTAPVTANTGGTSVGNPNAGLPVAMSMPQRPTIETRDRVAAGFLTTAMALGVLSGAMFVVK